MSSVNDTHSVNDNYFSVNNSTNNSLYNAKLNQSRSRACSSSKVESKRKISNVSCTPSKTSTHTSPPINYNLSSTRSRSHSHTSSVHSDQSSNFKYKMELSESPPSSPHLKASNSNENNSISNYSKQNLQKNSFGNILTIAENDVTSQLSSSYSISSNTNSSVIANSNNKNVSNDNSLSSPPSIQQKMREMLRDNRSKGRKMSFNSTLRDRETFHHRPSSSDIGSYHISSNGMMSLKPKSSISYQYDSNRTLNGGLNANAMSNHNPNIPSSNYLSVNNIEVRKKYSSCYSISSNSTALPPPKKYLNHNYSIYRYPKIIHMLYVFLIMFIIYIINFFATYSTRWIVVNTSQKTTNTTEASFNDSLLYHFEFGMFNYCFQAKTATDNAPKTCDKISEHCPVFCSNTSCIKFNPKKDGEILESDESEKDRNGPEDPNDPTFSFCKLTTLSRKISFIYTILNTLNIAVAIAIIIVALKYRGNEKGKLKNELIKRLSYISDRYSYFSKNKLKNSNTNVTSNNTSSMVLKDENNNNLTSIGFHYQYNEPEAIDIDESEQDEKKKISSNNNTHLTYHLPLSTNNTNNEPSGNVSTPCITPEYIEEQNRIKLAEEEQTIRRKKMLKTLFALLILISISLSVIGIYFIVKWAEESNHIGMTYTDIKDDEVFMDSSVGVSLILITIATVLNVILALYLIGLLSVIHFSRSKTYWNTENDEDTYSQSYDSVHPSSSYTPSFNNNFYNQSNSYIPNANSYVP